MSSVQEQVDLIWDSFDKDGSGNLCKKEAANLIRAIAGDEANSLTEEDLGQYIELLDADGDGDIQKDDLIKLLSGN